MVWRAEQAAVVVVKTFRGSMLQLEPLILMGHNGSDLSIVYGECSVVAKHSWQLATPPDQ